MVTDAHLGGYAEGGRRLSAFIREVEAEYALKLDPIYTAKVFLSVLQQVQAGELDGKRIVLLHTGGLQGFAPWMEKFS